MLDLSIAGILLAPSGNDGNHPIPLTIDALCNRIGDAVDTLGIIREKGTRVFEIADAHIPANSPEEALFIYDTITRSGLRDNTEVVAPAVSEVFEPLDVRANMQARFAGRSTTPG